MENGHVDEGNMSKPFTKNYTSALCVVPPRRLWDAIQRLRVFNDRNFVRWPPHINLLYPFVSDKKEDLQKAAELASHELSKLQPFQITLDNVSHFKHSGSCTLLLESQNSNLKELHAALLKAFPDFNDTTLDQHGNFRGFNPHLSLGQCKHEEVEKVAQEFQSQMDSLEFEVGSVDIISREGPADIPFRFRYNVPLGGGQPQLVDIPYVATIGPFTSHTLHPKADQYGIGGEDDGVWYFAFGANMSKKKLTGTRKIEPLESVAVECKGWALEFNHRGAMGNIVKLEPGATGSGGFSVVHGVAHRIKAEDFASLTQMEHEYRPTELVLDRYDGKGQIRSVGFVSPPEKHIKTGLPPTLRYANLLRGGAAEFELNKDFQDWLNGIDTVPSDEKRGDEYWQDHQGTHIPMRPRIWNGSEKSRHQGRGGRGRGRGRGGRGRSGGNRGRGNRASEQNGHTN